MTPQEIFEYKHRWLVKSSNSIEIHSDREFEAKLWCRANVSQYSWYYGKYTGPYTDTILFETPELLEQFKTYWSEAWKR